ncbi:MAG: peptidoglycan endopeptidase, partial [Deltaproteobacteria bacterium]
MRIIFILLSVLALTQTAHCEALFFGVVRTPAPVLNSPDFRSVFGGKDGSSLKTDRCGQVRELEYIALSGTVFKILGELKLASATTYQVETEEYLARSGIRLYVDSRFIVRHSAAPPSRKRSLPAREHVLATLLKSAGAPYVWGGNVQEGVPELSHYYIINVRDSGSELFNLSGLDCSGLLYQATAGWTPRNTSQLISFGQPVTIKGKNVEEIARLLEPLDLIVWDGHVIIVLDRETVIESKLECRKPGNGGVVKRPLLLRLRE